MTAPSQLAGTPPSAQPIDPYTSAGPITVPAHLSGPPASAKPIDPYAPYASAGPRTGPTTRPAHVAGPPASAKPIDPYTSTGPIEGPITRPSQLAGLPASTTPIDPYTRYTSAGPITRPSQLTGAPGDRYQSVGPNTRPTQLVGPPASAKPIDPYTSAGPITTPSQLAGPPASAKPIDPYASAGPVTAPSRLVGPPAHPTETSALPRLFDRVFDRYRGAIPIEYLRALVERESSFKPTARTGHAIGLMQIVPVVLDDYNKRHGTHYASEHLVDPAINVAIGCELLRLIITSYQRNHPHIPNLQPDWDNPRFAELVSFGWNAGYSESGGVGRVARYLERLGAIDITIDLVHDHARIAGASTHLSNPAKVRWCKSVVALYQRERASSRIQPRTPTRVAIAS